MRVDQTQVEQDHVESAALGRKEQLPGDEGDKCGHGPGNQDQPAPELAPADGLVQQHGDAKPKDQFQGLHRDDQHDGVAYRGLKADPVEEVAIVGETDEIARLADHAVGEADPDREQKDRRPGPTGR